MPGAASRPCEKSSGERLARRWGAQLAPHTAEGQSLAFWPHSLVDWENEEELSEHLTPAEVLTHLKKHGEKESKRPGELVLCFVTNLPEMAAEMMVRAEVSGGVQTAVGVCRLGHAGQPQHHRVRAVCWGGDRDGPAPPGTNWSHSSMASAPAQSPEPTNTRECDSEASMQWAFTACRNAHTG